MVDWKEIRKKFPAIEKSVYLNSASISPIFREAAEAGKRFYDDVLFYGDSKFDEWLSKRERVREKVADFINADKSEVAFIPNTSFGMNIIAQILKGKGEVVTMDDEFPSSIIPWVNQDFRLTFVKPKNNTYPINLIDEKVREVTKILVSCHVQAFTGFKQNLAELGKYCKSRGLIFVVNATQSAGVVPIDVKKAGIDFLVFSSVKWLMTGNPLGAIYINRKWFDKIKWPIAGWMSVKDLDMDNKNWDLKNDASVLEVGGPPFHSIFVLEKAIDLINDIGMENIENRLNELTEYLIEGLKESGIEIDSPTERESRPSFVMVRTREPKEIVKKLLEKRIIVSERKGKIRISLHIFNNKEDIDKLLTELTKIIN